MPVPFQLDSTEDGTHSVLSSCRFGMLRQGVGADFCLEHIPKSLGNRAGLICSYDDSCAVFFYVCASTSCVFFSSFRYAYLLRFMVNDVSYELLHLFLSGCTGNGIGKFL